MGKAVLLSALLGLLLVACRGGLPDIALDRSEANLGRVTNGELRSLEVKVENRGQGELQILAVTTSCGCTEAAVQPTAIGAGSSGRLLIRYDSGAHGSEFEGRVMRQVFIASNDPDEPEVEFRFSAEVVPEGK